MSAEPVPVELPRRLLPLTAAEFIAIPRPPVDPLVASRDGRTTFLAPETILIAAGPSGVGKSLIGGFDLGGRLAADESSEWLGLTVKGGQRVLVLPFEGSDEDTRERLDTLVPDSARDKRFIILDHWRGAPLPRAGVAGEEILAGLIRDLEIDVLIIDTGAAFFGGAHDITKGIPEAAHESIVRVRASSGRRFACIVVVHTRKLDRRGSSKVDELEEISGTFARKADAAIVIRVDGDDASPRRHIKFAKVRRGPKLRSLIATFPEDPDAPARVSVVVEAGRPLLDGTEAEAIAAWIHSHPEPVAVAQIRVKFNLSDASIRRRADALAHLGIEKHRVPGGGNGQAYGTQAQWRAVTFAAIEAAS